MCLAALEFGELRGEGKSLLFWESLSACWDRVMLHFLARRRLQSIA
jgi:hypothetical protein